MSVRVFRPTYLIEELGELGRLPNGAITNIGGTEGPYFTVGGKALLFADGTSSAPGGAGGTTIQVTYDNQITGVLNLSAGKNFVFHSLGGNNVIIDATTGNTTIDGALTVTGLINGVNLTDLTAHLNGLTTPPKHTAAQISTDQTNFSVISGTNVQQVLDSVDFRLQSISAGGAEGFEYIQIVPALIWTIAHNRNTRRVQVTVWDDTDNAVFADTVSIVDANTVRVVFNTPASGRAILMLF